MSDLPPPGLGPGVSTHDPLLSVAARDDLASRPRAAFQAQVAADSGTHNTSAFRMEGGSLHSMGSRPQDIPRGGSGSSPDPSWDPHVYHHTGEALLNPSFSVQAQGFTGGNTDQRVTRTVYTGSAIDMGAVEATRRLINVFDAASRGVEPQYDDLNFLRHNIAAARSIATTSAQIHLVDSIASHAAGSRVGYWG